MTIEIGIREVKGRPKTMSVYRLPKNAALTFVNESKTGQLIVTPKLGDSFCQSSGESAKIEIAPGGSQTVYIREEFALKEKELLYTARIDKADADDPIVIIEK